MAEGVGSTHTLQRAARFGLNMLMGRRSLSTARSAADYHLARRKPLVQLEITSRCNTACGCCTRDPHVVGVPTNLTMTLPDVRRMLEPYSPSNIRGLALSGSESLLHPEFFGIVDLIGQRFPLDMLTLFTNGIVLSQNRQVLERVGDLKLGSITFSLQGAVQSTVDRLQPGVSIERVVAAAEYLSSRSCPLWASYVVQRSNVAEMIDFVDAIAAAGFRGVTFLPYNAADAVSGPFDYETEWAGIGFWEMLERAEVRAAEHGILVTPVSELCGCEGVDVTRATGAVVTCQGNSRVEYTVGNLLVEDYSAIVRRRNRALKAVFRSTRFGRIPKMCAACAIRGMRAHLRRTE